MNIVLGTELFLPGVSGIITAVRNLAEELRGAGHQVTLICPDSASARYWASRHRVVLLGVRGVPIPGRIHQRVCLRLCGNRNHARAVLRAAHVVHLHSPFLLGLAIARLAREEGVPVVVTNHALPENLIGALRLPLTIGSRVLSPGLWQWIGKGIRLADVVTAPTAFAAQILRDHVGNIPVHVISNGVRQLRDPPRVLSVQQGDEPFLALYVGRLQREKRVDELLHAVRACQEAAIAVELTVVGDGPDRGRLERTARRIGITQYVRFVGLVSDDRRDFLYTHSHCLWMASRAELQCCAALEAMAAGRPVIGVRAGALPETVLDGIAGRLYDPGNVGQIVEIMSEFRRNPEVYRRLSRGASTVAAQHRSSDCCSANVDLYSSLVLRTAPELEEHSTVIQGGECHA